MACRTVKFRARGKGIVEFRACDRAARNRAGGYGGPRRSLASNGSWIPANQGKEEPFVTRSGRRLWYMWQPSTGRHAYLDVDTDLILTDEEAAAYLMI